MQPKSGDITCGIPEFKRQTVSNIKTNISIYFPLYKHYVIIYSIYGVNYLGACKQKGIQAAAYN